MLSTGQVNLSVSASMLRARPFTLEHFQQRTAVVPSTVEPVMAWCLPDIRKCFIFEVLPSCEEIELRDFWRTNHGVDLPKSFHVAMVGFPGTLKQYVSPHDLELFAYLL